MKGNLSMVHSSIEPRTGSNLPWNLSTGGASPPGSQSQGLQHRQEGPRYPRTVLLSSAPKHHPYLTIAANRPEQLWRPTQKPSLPHKPTNLPEWELLRAAQHQLFQPQRIKDPPTKTCPPAREAVQLASSCPAAAERQTRSLSPCVPCAMAKGPAPTQGREHGPRAGSSWSGCTPPHAGKVWP